MTQARQNLISLSDTPYYHVMGRCVRRAFLCGEDSFTGKSYEHRKQWIVDKLSELSADYLIDICAYAVMSNHYHLVLKVNKEKAMVLTEDEVIERWTSIFNGNVLVQRYQKGDCHTEAEIDKVKEILDMWRERLYDISWFMRCLNESIARQANEEDKCTGRFWEGRFKSQSLLNEQAVLACMAYVDLNPIRAGISDSLDTSAFTSISQRIEQYALTQEYGVNQDKIDEETEQLLLADFVGGKDTDGIAYTFMDYLELVDWTGKAIREDKVGHISKYEPKILDKLGFNSEIWFKAVSLYSNSNYTYIGADDQLKAICEDKKQKWVVGAKLCRELYLN